MTNSNGNGVPQAALAPAVRAFVALIEMEGLTDDERMKRLAASLDALSLAYHSAVPVQDAPGAGEPPQRDYQALRARVGAAFPALGYYPIASAGDDDEAEITMGDAIDDLTDIYSEMLDVAWCLDTTSAEDAERLFRFGFSHHWGRHLCDVRGALHRELFGM